MIAALPIASPAPKIPVKSHLDQLEAESIHILREVAASYAHPVILYSVGKDSSVLVHLARKAFFPGKLPASFRFAPQSALETLLRCRVQNKTPAV